MRSAIYILTILVASITLCNAQYIVNDAFKKITLPVADITVSGDIGTAFETVDHYSSFAIVQTTPGIVLTLPTPTDTTWGDDVTVRNIGTVNFTMYGVVMIPDSFELHVTWKRGAWKLVGTYGTGGGGGGACTTCSCDTILFFKSDSIANISGVNQYAHYILSQANEYGDAYGIVKIQVEYATYSGILAAGCISNFPTTMNLFKSDSLAVASGLTLNQYYILDAGNDYAGAFGTIKRITEP